MGLQRRQVSLQIDDRVGAAFGVDALDRLEDAVGARGVVGPGHHGLAACGHHGVADLLGVRRHHDAPGIGRDRAPPHLHDHGRAGDIHQGLSGQARRLQAGGDEDQRIGQMGTLGEFKG